MKSICFLKSLKQFKNVIAFPFFFFPENPQPEKNPFQNNKNIHVSVLISCQKREC